MKILFLITQSEIGGAQRFLLEFAPYLVQKGHKIIVAAGEGDGELFKNLESRIKNLESRMYEIKYLVRNLNPLKDTFALFALFKIIKKERPDILFLQSTKAGFLGSLAAKLCNIRNTKYKIRVVYRIGGWAFNDPRPWWMNRIVFWMEKISAAWKDVIIVNSEYDRQLAIKKRVAAQKKIVKIYNGIDPAQVKFSAQQEAKRFIQSQILHILSRATSPLTPFPINDSEKAECKGVLLVGTIANLYATKGIECLIESAHTLTKSYKLKAINFIVIGEGPQRPTLEALIKKYHLENNFFLLGRVPNAAKYLKAFDIFILPSVKEGFPWVLLEAMDAEVPIIATKVGAVPEAIEDGKDGLLIPPKDSRAMAQKISAFSDIHNTHDREEYVKNAKEKLKQFSLQKMLEKSEHVFKIT